MAIKVIGAAYGSKTAGVDVTQVVQQRLDAGNDDVIVDNNAFGVRTRARRSDLASFTSCWTQGRYGHVVQLRTRDSNWLTEPIPHT
jgi:hypothetical protein